MKRLFTLILSISIVVTSCGKNDEKNGTEQDPVAPTAITAEPASISAEAGGGSFAVKLTAPSRPKVSGLTDWISIGDGTFNGKTFQMTITLKVGSNTEYEERKATLTISATGAPDISLPVSQAAREIVKDPTLPDNDAVKRSFELGLGWNLGNHFDAYSNGVADETAWGASKATQATFTGVKAAGFSTVRIPVTWLGHIGEAPDYTLDEVWLNRVYEVVGFAENAGLNVILNTHHDEDHGDNHWLNLKAAVDSEESNARIKEQIAAVWTQIAGKFKDKGDFLMLESFNELIYGDQWSIGSNPEKKGQVINEWNQVFVDAVRATGGNNATRWLGVPGYAANPQYLKYFTLPEDPASKTMVAFHCYDPYDYTIGEKQLKDWGHSGTSYPRGEEEIKDLFNSLFNTYLANNIPIYMGEFGCSMRNHSDSRAWSFYMYYMEYFVKAARTFGLPAVLWDNGNMGYGAEHHPYLDHASGGYLENAKEVVDVMVKAWYTSSETYTLDYVYNSAPTF